MGQEEMVSLIKGTECINKWDWGDSDLMSWTYSIHPGMNGPNKPISHCSRTIELPFPMRKVVDRPGAAPVPQRVPPWRRPPIGSIRINLDQIGSYLESLEESPDHQREEEEEELTAPDHQHWHHKLQVDQWDKDLNLWFVNVPNNGK